MLERIAERILDQALRAFYKKKYNWNSGNTGFPLSRAWENHIRVPLFPEGDRGYYSGIHQAETDPFLSLDLFGHRLEILCARRQPAGRPYRVVAQRDSVLPCRVITPGRLSPTRGWSLSVSEGGRTLSLGNMMAERFYYLPLRKDVPLELSSAQDLAIGEPMPLIQRAPHKKRLVLVLFVDGLSGEAFASVPEREAMPNTHRFFSKGMVFENCHVTGEWSLPGLASIFSGLRSAGHGMLHPRKDIVIGKDYPIMSELFQKQGYSTFQACGNWRKSPSYGYVKGFDRTIYKRQMPLQDVNHAFFDHLRAFPKRDVFAWLSCFELHHFLGGVPDISCQTRYPLQAHDYAAPKKKSVYRLEVDEVQRTRYFEELNKIDHYLGQIFRHIEDNYSDDEILVCLVADHGTSDLTPDPHFLSRERTHVPFMIRGGGVPAGRSSEWIQNIDVLPALLRHADISAEGAVFDGRVPAALGGGLERSGILCESRHPGAAYKATIKDAEHDFYFETRGPVDDDGRFDPADHVIDLFHHGDFSRSILKDRPEAAAAFERELVEFLKAGGRESLIAHARTT